MENNQNIQKLFAKYLDNTISSDEYETLLHYFRKQEDHGALDELVLKELSDGLSERNHVRLEKAVDAVSHRLREQLHPKKTIKLRKYIPYAAAVLLFFTIGISFYFISTNHRQKRVEFAAIADVSPGRSAATLTLSNGKKIQLDVHSSGTLASEQGIEVSKTTDGAVVYTGRGMNGSSNTDLNTLSTANGETYRITLSDGSKVWLNAATSLQYAANLGAGGLRKVKLLAGEAYFEVQKDTNHPFIVETPSQKVEVLGIHFNINSYADEGKTVTTLAEGSVKVSTPGDRGRSTILKPGQQSFIADAHIQVHEADLQVALAWKDGKIYFKDAPIQDVLRQVSRWYDIQVEYKGEPTKEVFNGGIKRSATLSSVLRILELSHVNFKLIKKNEATVLIVAQTK